MFGAEPDIANSALRLWVAAGSAALLVFICALAFDWTRTRTVARVGVVVLGAVLGATLAWAFLDAASVRDQSAERRALEARAAELNAESLAPGSPLACLNGLAGDKVEAACEKVLFAAPSTVASATSYVAARFSLLADMDAYTRRGGGNIDSILLPLRRSLEADRFGFVAHTLAVADGCTSDHCKALALLDNSSQIRANLSAQTLGRYLDRYVAVWAQEPNIPLADASSPSAAMGQPGAPAPHKLVDIDFPSADSIPPVSIMNPEPKGSPTAAAVASATAGEPNPHEAAHENGRENGHENGHEASHETPATSRRARKQPVNPPAQAAVVAPPATMADPVWIPKSDATAPAAAAAAPPAANSQPGGLGPVQLNPFQPQAGAGAAHTP
ncbi:MAG: hypothetical protein WCA56_21240 [Xanthobacteraceae bacterium]|jgi:hypothetical protein